MATTLSKTKIALDLGNIVTNSINAVCAERANDQSQKEAAFQKAIADGMSYEDQVKFRSKQIDEEKASTFSDPDYIDSLTKSVADTKKLARFAKYRNTHSNALNDLTSGKTNAENYLATLKSTLIGVTDDDLRQEINGDIATATKTVATYHDTILSNQVKKAQYDGTAAVLNDAIARVTSHKLTAAIGGNDDTTTADDATLAALNSQLSTVKVNDSITDYQAHSATKGIDPMDKLNFINSQVAGADPNSPVKIGDTTYASAQAFWSGERDNFLAGNSKIFGDFFGDLKTTTDNAVKASTAKFGYPTQDTLDSALKTFNDLRAKPEVAPFLAKVDTTQAGVMSSAVDSFAKAISTAVGDNFNFKEADAQLVNLGTKYGVDTSQYRTALDEKLYGYMNSGLVSKAEAAGMATDVNLKIPKIEPVPSPKPETPVVTTDKSNAHTVVAGDTLISIARQNNTSVNDLLNLNPEFKTNPNFIKPGQKVALPTAPVPATEPVKPVAPVTPVTPVTSPTATPPVSPTPATPAIPTTPATPEYATAYNPVTKERKKVTVGDPNAFAGGWVLETPNNNLNTPK